MPYVIFSQFQTAWNSFFFHHPNAVLFLTWLILFCSCFALAIFLATLDMGNPDIHEDVNHEEEEAAFDKAA